MQAFIRQMSREIREQIVPLIRALEPQYTADNWPDDMRAAIDRLVERWTGSLFRGQAERIAARTVSRADAANQQDFLNSVNRAVGVDFFQATFSQGLTDYLVSTTFETQDLVISIPEQHFTRIGTIVLSGMGAGRTPGAIAREISQQTGIAQRRAKLIARNQLAKINGDLTQRRQQNAGIEFFQWITSRDERVGDDHREAANRETDFGIGVYRWDDPPPEGIPGHSTRPNCRCTARPIFPWQLERLRQQMEQRNNR